MIESLRDVVVEPFIGITETASASNPVVAELSSIGDIGSRSSKRFESKTDDTRRCEFAKAVLLPVRGVKDARLSRFEVDPTKAAIPVTGGV